MTLTVKHGFTSGIADDPTAAAAGEVLPSHWNANHGVTGTVGPEIGARTILTANTNYYVATTGNDSNPGTLASPWATLQHASNFISSQIDIAGFIITVNIGTGSFAGIANASCLGGGAVLFIGNGSTNTTLTPGPDGTVLAFFSQTTTEYGFNKFNLDGQGNRIVDIETNGLVIFLGDFNFVTNDLIFTDTVGLLKGCFVEAESLLIFPSGGTITVTAPHNISQMLDGHFFAQIQDFGAWVVSGTPTCTSEWLFLGDGSMYAGFAAYTSTVTGPRVLIQTGSVTDTGSGGSPTFFPGNSFGIVDNSSSYDGFFGHAEASGLPTTTQFPTPGTGGLYKDTSGGGVYMVYNDAGTIKKVQLT